MSRAEADRGNSEETAASAAAAAAVAGTFAATVAYSGSKKWTIGVY